MPPPPALMEELIEEILFRLPPDEPASLFRASLVSKPWCRLISGTGFRRRYREFHRTPPMLGFLCGQRRCPPHAAGIASDGVQLTTRFVPTSTFCLVPAERRRCRLIDARHGRVLLLLHRGEPGRESVLFLLVWDPVTNEEREIPLRKLRPSVYSWNAAVVCAAAAGGACDHLDCHGGAFLVIFVVSCSASAKTFVWTYSSETRSWSDAITQQHEDYVDSSFPSVLVGNVLYYKFMGMMRALKYDFEFHQLSVFGLPSSFRKRVGVFRSTDDGCLGFATIHESKLYMWSRKHGPQVDVVWTCDRVIELETLLSSNAVLTDSVLLGFLDRIGVILLRADNALYTVDLKTPKVKKVCDGANNIVNVVPYMSFRTSALGGGLGGEGPSGSVSSA